MTTMNISQARKTFNELTQNFQNGKLEKNKMDKFFIKTNILVVFLTLFLIQHSVIQ